MPLLKRDHFVSMYTGLSDEPIDPTIYHYVLNLIPQQGGRLTQRPPLQFVSGSGSLNFYAWGTLRGRSGPTNWALSTEPVLYTVSVSGANITLTAVVSAANFTTAAVTPDANARRWGQYTDATKDYIVFADAGQPWAWDGGSGAGSLTPLTNAPATTLRPTSYGGKLFFIKSADTRTIAWSEEFAINTGYEATGYSNAWTLGQTSSEGLNSILGTNDGLYFARNNSIGRIRGTISADFATSATHDDVSTIIGTNSEMVLGENEVWTLDYDSQLWRIPFGGVPQRVPLGTIEPPDPVAVGVTGGRIIEPFGFGAFSIRGFSTGQVSDNLRYQTSMRFMSGRSLIWAFPFATNTSVTDKHPAALLVDAESAKPLAWFLFTHAASGTSQISTGFWDIPVATGLQSCLVVNAPDTSGLWVLGVQASSSAWVDLLTGGDKNASNVAQTTVYRFISGPIRLPDVQTRIGDLTLVLEGRGAISGTAAIISTRAPDTSLLTAQAWSVTFSSTYREAKTIRLGWEDEAMWGRILVTVSSASLSDFGIKSVAFNGEPVTWEDAA